MSEDAYMSLPSGHIALVEAHRELVAERDRLETDLDALTAYVKPIKAERDRLQAVVDRTEREWLGMRAARDEAMSERDRLRAVVRKLVAAAGLAIEGTEGEWLSYAHDEYASRHEFTAEERVAYQRALDRSTEATDG